MLRYWIAVFIAIALGMSAPVGAEQMLAADEALETTIDSPDSPETWPADGPAVPPTEWPEDAGPKALEEYPHFPESESCVEPIEPAPTVWPLRWLGLRHSHTHGRHVGRGTPLVGTSWLNRPYYVGAELGTLWLTRSIDENVSRDIDAFGGVFAGWDTDHYWGGELRFNWATPELKNSAAPDANRTDSLFMWSYSVMYYPWGDSKIRPYWRCGVGNTRFDFPLDNGSRHDEWMLNFPFGLGVKYPIRRWLVARAEITDHLTIGDDRFPTQNNLTLTLGAEWRFGAHPRSYWPWHPDRHIW